MQTELIILAKSGDPVSMDKLLRLYKSLVLRVARQFFMTGGGGHEDLVQEGMIGLYKAILGFDQSKNDSFSAFAALCIKRQIIDAVRKNNGNKNFALNTYVALEEDGKDGDVAAQLFAPKSDDPEDSVIRSEVYGEIMQKTKVLSKLELKVLEEFLDGKSYLQIANGIGGTEKTVDNAIQRIRKKLKH